jgi:hypothetical protein
MQRIHYILWENLSHPKTAQPNHIKIETIKTDMLPLQIQKPLQLTRIQILQIMVTR